MLIQRSMIGNDFFDTYYIYINDWLVTGHTVYTHPAERLPPSVHCTRGNINIAYPEYHNEYRNWYNYIRTTIDSKMPAFAWR
jgi:hypothetical protein